MKVFVRFYYFVFRYKRQFVTFGVLWLMSSIFNSVQPFFLKWITQAVQKHDFAGTGAFIAGLGAVLVGGNLTSIVAQYFGDRAVLSSAADVQHLVMKRIHDLDFAFHTNKSSGKMISIMRRGDDAFQSYFELLNLELANIGISFAVMLYAFSQVGLRYVLLAFLATVFLAIGGMPLLKMNLERRKKWNDADDNLSGIRTDNLVNFDTVKYFAKESYEQTRMRNMLNDWVQTGMHYSITFRYFDLLVGNLTNITMVGALFFLTSDLALHRITLGEFVLVISFTASFFPKLWEVLMVTRNITRRYPDIQAYFGLLDEPVVVVDPDRPKNLDTIAGEIRFDHVGFAYPDGRNVFSDFDLKVKPGEAVALVGYSGSGKTTAVKLLMRMYDVDNGKITIDGVNVSEMKKSELRSQIGIVPQDPMLFNNSIYYNLVYSRPEASEDEVKKAIEAVKLDSFINSLLLGAETMVGERGIKLSGGQRQRLAIARVLLGQPPIVILDEATSSLDSESEAAIQDAFWKFVKNPDRPRTSIIIAHRLSTVMRCDRIIVLDNGAIAEEGTHRELLKKPQGIYKKLWELQENGFLDEDTKPEEL